VNGWHAIIPLNLGRDCKTRLAGHLPAGEREALVRAMAAHVIAAVQGSAHIGSVAMLSPDRHNFADVGWVKDRGRGLNAELAAALGATCQLIVHADLPMLASSDIDALIVAAEQAGAAIAPDHFGTGTNGLALCAAAGFVPAFGVGSCARHKALLPGAALVDRLGLAHDIDTVDDYAAISLSRSDQ
jgi:2-phospho-L-lactate/phosphoenolpyruvate guanylyltransferase